MPPPTIDNLDNKLKLDIIGCATDVSTTDGRDDLMRELKNWLGERQRLDILVNNGQCHLNFELN